MIGSCCCQNIYSQIFQMKIFVASVYFNSPYEMIELMHNSDTLGIILSPYMTAHLRFQLTDWAHWAVLTPIWWSSLAAMMLSRNWTTKYVACVTSQIDNNCQILCSCVADQARIWKLMLAQGWLFYTSTCSPHACHPTPFGNEISWCCSGPQVPNTLSF